MEGMKKEATSTCIMFPEPASKTPITLIRGISSSMVNIPTYLTTPVGLGHLSGSSELPMVKFMGQQPVNMRDIKPDIQFRTAVVGVGVFLVILCSVLVMVVMWFSHQSTEKEIERNYLNMFNITDMMDRYITLSDKV